MEAYGAAASVLEQIPAPERQKDATVMRLLTLASGKGKDGAEPSVRSRPPEEMRASD